MATKKQPAKKADKWPVTLKAGLLKGRTVASQKEYNELLEAEQERTGTPKIYRKRPGESVQQAVTRALKATEPRTKKAVADHRAKTAARKTNPTKRPPTAKK